MKLEVCYKKLSKSDLSSDERDLLEKAEYAKENAYSEYSKFSVGAAILLENNSIVIGNNQENAVYPSGLCAERVAVFSASANHPNIVIKKIFIVAGNESKTTFSPVPPCGSCRQVLLEYELKQDDKIQIFFKGDSDEIIKLESISELLPFSFTKKML